MPPSSDDEIPISRRGAHTFDRNRLESRRRATFGRVAGGSSTSSTDEPPQPEIIPIQRGTEPSGSSSSPVSSSLITATATASSSATTPSASMHEKNFKEQQRRRLMYLQETRQNQQQHKRQTQSQVGIHPLSKSFTANAKNREVLDLDTPPPSSHVLSSPLNDAHTTASILEQQVQQEHQQAQQTQKSQKHQQQPQQQPQNKHQQETQQPQQPQQGHRQQQDDNEIAIREESLELLENLASITSDDMNRGNSGGGAFGRNDIDDSSSNNNSHVNSSNKRRAEVDLERPTTRRLFSGITTPGRMSGSVFGSSDSVFGPSGPGVGVGPHAPAPGASPPRTPMRPASFDAREGPSSGGVAGDRGGESPFLPFSRGASPMPQAPFSQASNFFDQPRTPGAVGMTGAAPQRGQVAPERGERAGSVASVTSITSRNGPPMANPSLPNLPPDGLVFPLTINKRRSK